MSEDKTLDCDGYRTLLAAVENDKAKEKNKGTECQFLSKLHWVVARAKHYAEKTGVSAEKLLDAWENKRDYWYMNYYQESNQPEIQDGKVRVFDTVEDLRKAIGDTGFRCPACEGVSKDPYECTTQKVIKGKKCDWKVYGLFGHMGKGISVFVKDQCAIQPIFMPVAWEEVPTEKQVKA